MVDTKNLNVEELVKDLNRVVQQMYSEGEEVVYFAREILAVLRRHKVGE